MARSCQRRDMLDWWQAVLDETKNLVDDTIDRVRDDDDDDDELADEVRELKQVVAALTVKLDRLLAEPAPAPAPAIADAPTPPTTKSGTRR